MIKYAIQDKKTGKYLVDSFDLWTDKIDEAKLWNKPDFKILEKGERFIEVLEILEALGEVKE